MVALRAPAEVLAAMVTVTMPLPPPPAGETVAQGSFELAVQLRFEFTVISELCAVAETVVVPGLIVIAGAVVTVSVIPSEAMDPAILETITP
jgi:hypothetical protein